MVTIQAPSVNSRLATISRLVDEKVAAEMLGITPGTLSVWRCVKRYNLPYKKIGRAVRYDVADLERFIAASTVGAAE